MQFTMVEYKERMLENQTTTRWSGTPREGMYKVGHGGKRKRNGRNNVFILCAWLNVFRGLLSETRGSDEEGKRKGKRREREEETKQRDWNVSWSCEWIYIIASTTLSLSRTESPSTAEADPRYWISWRNSGDIKGRRGRLVKGARCRRLFAISAAIGFPLKVDYGRARFSELLRRALLSDGQLTLLATDASGLAVTFVTGVKIEEVIEILFII